MGKFIITEEEKNRILGMHKSRTKNHYLMEQEISGTTEVPDCVSLLKTKESDGTIGGSPYEDLVVDGDIEMTYNGNSTVSPEKRAVTIIKDGTPFCKIRSRNNIGDCKDKMTKSGDAVDSLLTTKLSGPIKINKLAGPPSNRPITISDTNGYFCKVPQLLSDIISNEIIIGTEQ